MFISASKRAAHAQIYFVPGAMRKTEGLSHYPKGAL